MPRVNDPFERQHIANLSKYAKIIDEIFKAATKEAASIGVIVGNGNFDASRVFSFADYPITHKMIQSLLSRLANSVETAIVNGVEAEWTLANNKNNELSRRVFGDNVGKLTQEQYRKYFSSNDEARKAFLARKEQGLNLSERVWRYTECFKSDIELGLDIGIRNGLDAAQMSRQLRQFLQHPDMLFRRVRDEHGNLVLSKRASDFHPGRGVYRSSYKNARRLAVTETNMAYRSADYERMQQLDFVVGIEIRLSNNHTTPGKNGLPIPLVDICDELKGKYPKDFKFTGWHPHCRCHVVSILKTESELMQENAAILRGEEPSKESVNAVTDVPKEFKDWVRDNAGRTARALSIPYFMRDNAKLVSDIFTKAQPSTEMWRTLNNTVAVYMRSMKDKDVRLTAIWEELHKDDLTDIETTMLLNRYREVAANVTFAELKKMGVVADGMVMKIDKGYLLQEKGVLTTSEGVRVNLGEVKRDMVVLRDRSGKEFAYPIGVDEEHLLFSAKSASEVVASLPPYLRRGIERVSFVDMICPADDYWKLQYKNPNHVSLATDGGKITFWRNPGDGLRGFLSHEAGHILDTPQHKISSSRGWLEAVKKDDEFYAQYGIKRSRVSRYAHTNDIEDFAECMKHYITEHEEFKKYFPNRAAFIRKMAQALSGHAPNTP